MSDVINFRRESLLESVNYVILLYSYKCSSGSTSMMYCLFNCIGNPEGFPMQLKALWTECMN